MSKKTELFKSEERKSLVQAATYLRTLADRIEMGRVTLTREDGGEVSLELPASVVMEIEAKEKSGKSLKRSLEVELEWTVGDEPGAAE